METILIMARALAKAASLDILRLDIQYNSIKDETSALCTLGNETDMYTVVEYIIHENGTVEKRSLS